MLLRAISNNENVGTYCKYDSLSFYKPLQRLCFAITPDSSVRVSRRVRSPAHRDWVAASCADALEQTEACTSAPRSQHNHRGPTKGLSSRLFPHGHGTAHSVCCGPARSLSKGSRSLVSEVSSSIAPSYQSAFHLSLMVLVPYRSPSDI